MTGVLVAALVVVLMAGPQVAAQEPPADAVAPAEALPPADTSLARPTLPAGRTIFERRSTLESGGIFVRRIVYAGEGWRNLRRLRFATFVENSPFLAHPLTQDWYYFCGRRAVAYISVVENVRGDENTQIQGVTPEESVITPGSLIHDLQNGVGRAVRPSEVSSFLTAMSSVCANPPLRTVTPALLHLGETNERVYHLVSNQFERSAAIATFWWEMRSIRKVSITTTFRGGEPWSMDALVLSDARGHDLVQAQANCVGASTRFLQIISYSSEGAVLQSSRYSRGTENDFQDVAPNSVAENIHRVVCLIE